MRDDLSIRAHRIIMLSLKDSNSMNMHDANIMSIANEHIQITVDYLETSVFSHDTEPK